MDLNAYGQDVRRIVSHISMIRQDLPLDLSNTGRSPSKTMTPSSLVTGAHPSNLVTGVHPSSLVVTAHPSGLVTGAHPCGLVTGVHPSSLVVTGAHPSSLVTGAHHGEATRTCFATTSCRPIEPRTVQPACTSSRILER